MKILFTFYLNYFFIMTLGQNIVKDFLFLYIFAAIQVNRNRMYFIKTVYPKIRNVINMIILILVLKVDPHEGWRSRGTSREGSPSGGIYGKWHFIFII